jgi:hypothetical protein
MLAAISTGSTAASGREPWPPWPYKTTWAEVPDQVPGARASKAAAPSRQVACMSWPQACMTGTSSPSWPAARTVLAYGGPVSSSTGSASKSARSITTGPSPLRSNPTTPVPPICSVTSKPRGRSAAAIRWAVRCSRSEGVPRSALV